MFSFPYDQVNWVSASVFGDPVLGVSFTGMLAMGLVVDLPVLLMRRMNSSHGDQHEETRHQLRKAD